jgi:protocatechuate 4,5-dioxygenase beta chain
VLPPIEGDLEFSWHLIESLVADEFDMTICQEMKVDHGFMVPVSLLWAGSHALAGQGDSAGRQHRPTSDPVGCSVL